MRKFWFLLWLDWLVFVTVSSLFFAAFFDFIVIFCIYIFKDMPTLDSVIIGALSDIWLFWFAFIWSATLLLSIFLSVKRLFNKCYNGYKLQILTCTEFEVIDIVLLGDTVKIWRKWLMVLIWGVASEILFVSVVRYFLNFELDFWVWFDVGCLYLFILLAALASLPLMAARCKRVRLSSC